jgi:hypothetical protein
MVGWFEFLLIILEVYELNRGLVDSWLRHYDTSR